eukprot:NODE_66_length_23959_cov_0.323009.p7 type:complete len:273 gc:universal NODE_66_length_23959_cov_0.323009:22120-22938(+)
MGIATTLQGGQSFTWHRINSYFFKAIKVNNTDCIIRLDDHINPYSYFGQFDAQEWFENYTRTEYNLGEMYTKWKEMDPKLEYYDIQLLNQEPLECILGFICSSNNNIKRIQRMMQSLCTLYGTFITRIEDIDVYSFPTLEQLSKVDETTLREHGFGYRAGYITSSVKYLINNPHLLDLHKLPYLQAKQELLNLKGVGYKVADCILLMGFGFMECVPIDVHIKRCIEQRYNFPVKSLSINHYEKLQEFLQSKWGEYAGWAHLFAFADMRKTKK